MGTQDTVKSTCITSAPAWINASVDSPAGNTPKTIQAIASNREDLPAPFNPYRLQLTGINQKSPVPETFLHNL